MCLHVAKKENCAHPVVVSIGYGIWLYSGFLHLKKNPDSQNRLSILPTQLHQDPVTHLHWSRNKPLLTKPQPQHRRKFPLSRFSTLCSQSMETVRWLYLIRGLQLFVLHISQHVVSSMKHPRFRVAGADICGQADEPQTVTMPEKTLGPHLWDGGVRLSHPLCWFDLLQREDHREGRH